MGDGVHTDRRQHLAAVEDSTYRSRHSRLLSRLPKSRRLAHALIYVTQFLGELFPRALILAASTPGRGHGRGICARMAPGQKRSTGHRPLRPVTWAGNCSSVLIRASTADPNGSGLRVRSIRLVSARPRCPFRRFLSRPRRSRLQGTRCMPGTATSSGYPSPVLLLFWLFYFVMVLPQQQVGARSPPIPGLGSFVTATSHPQLGLGAPVHLALLPTHRFSPPLPTIAALDVWADGRTALPRRAPALHQCSEAIKI